MLQKSKLVNTLFLAGFPLFGYGSHYGNYHGLSMGLMISMSAFVAILLFYLVDMLYRQRVERMLTRTWWLCVAYNATLVVAMFVGLRNGIPGLQAGNVILSCLLFMAPFHAALVVLFYNRTDPDFNYTRLLFTGLGLLVGINILAFAAGIQAFGEEGGENYITLPFFRGRYTGVHVISVFSLMLLFHLRSPWRRPVLFMTALMGMLVCIGFMVFINSRISFLIFLLLAVLFTTRAMKIVRGLYTTSLFILPLLLSFSLLVYEVISQPVFAQILKRVKKEDVTTFNGRSFIWEAVGNWAANDRTGLLLGNGYKGHYKLHLFDKVAVLWNEKHPFNLHSHSTFAEVLVGQGILGVVLLYVIFWRGFKHYREQYILGTRDAPMFGGFAYLLFIWQLDIFCYGTDLGHSILFCMLAPLCMRLPTHPENKLLPAAA